MTSPLIGGHVQPKSAPTQVQSFKTEAYSDDGYRRKQSGGRPKPSRGEHASRAPNYLKPKEFRENSVSAHWRFDLRQPLNYLKVQED
jgi:hypothetical protein